MFRGGCAGLWLRTPGEYERTRSHGTEDVPTDVVVHAPTLRSDLQVSENHLDIGPE